MHISITETYLKHPETHLNYKSTEDALELQHTSQSKLFIDLVIDKGGPFSAFEVVIKKLNKYLGPVAGPRGASQCLETLGIDPTTEGKRKEGGQVRKKRLREKKSLKRRYQLIAKWMARKKHRTARL